MHARVHVSGCASGRRTGCVAWSSKFSALEDSWAPLFDQLMVFESHTDVARVQQIPCGTSELDERLKADDRTPTQPVIAIYPYMY